MIRKLLLFCLLISLYFSLISCARRLTFQERVDCNVYCVDKHCIKKVKFKSVDSMGLPVEGILSVANPTCISGCISGCKYSDGIYAKEWLETKKKK